MTDFNDLPGWRELNAVRACFSEVLTLLNSVSSEVYQRY
jgi:hypothetical protein